MIVLLAPYGRTEVTAAAVRLADLAQSLGHQVRLVACGQQEKHVHPAWDGRVKSGRRHGVYVNAKGATHVVHFQASGRLYDHATLVTAKPNAKHILVPNWHALAASDADLIGKYDQVVCPTKTCHKVVNQLAFRGKGERPRLSWLRWDAGVPPVRRDGLAESERMRACVFCDTSAVDFCGPMVVQLANELLHIHPKLELTVMAVKSWAGRDRQDWKRALANWPRRLSLRGAASAVDLNREFHAHDWVVLPSVRADFGLTASRALACGAPVIANDVPPFSEVVSADSGILVPCEVRTGAAKAPIAVPNMGKWLEVCSRAFADARTLFGLQTRDWKLSEACQTFNDGWRRAWDA